MGGGFAVSKELGFALIPEEVFDAIRNQGILGYSPK